MQRIKAFIKKVLRKPCAFFARRHEKYKDWKYIWGGKMRAHYLKLVLAECGPCLTINGKPTIYEPHKIHLGNHVTINNGCQISPRADVYIGDHVTMSRGSQITAGSLDTENWAEGNYLKREHTQGEVHIAEGAWLCINSIVLPGVRITGKGVIVAAGAVVTKDITEDFVVVGGAPARIVKDLKKKPVPTEADCTTPEENRDTREKE